MDGLTGLKEAIYASYPKVEIQRCIIHQLRNSFKYVSYKDLKEFSRDFKEVYKAVNEDDAYLNLGELEEKWGKKYPHAIRSWEVLSPFSDIYRGIIFYGRPIFNWYCGLLLDYHIHIWN